MATYWVDDSGSDGNAGTVYTSPKATIWGASGAAQATAAGERVYVLSASGNIHTESYSGAAKTAPASGGSMTNPIEIIAVNTFNSGNPNAESHLSSSSERAIIEVTGGYDWRFENGSSENYYGLHFKSSDYMRMRAATSRKEAYNCVFELTTNSASDRWEFDSASSLLRFQDCWFKAANVGQYANMGAGYQNVVFEGGGLDSTGSAIQDFLSISGDSNFVKFHGFDFTGGASTFAICVALPSSTSTGNHYLVINCDLPTTTTISSDTMDGPKSYLLIDNSDDADDIRRELLTSEGTIKIDLTTYLDAGWDDAIGSGAGPSGNLSHAMIPDSLVTPRTPLYAYDCCNAFMLMSWIDSTGSYTFAVEAVHDYASLTQQDAWLELFYLGTSGETHVLVANGRQWLASDALATSSNGASEWTGEPSVGTTVYSTLEVDATVSRVGYYGVRVVLGDYEAGRTFYYDPKVTVS